MAKKAQFHNIDVINFNKNFEAPNHLINKNLNLAEADRLILMETDTNNSTAKSVVENLQKINFTSLFSETLTFNPDIRALIDSGKVNADDIKKISKCLNSEFQKIFRRSLKGIIDSLKETFDENVEYIANTLKKQENITGFITSNLKRMLTIVRLKGLVLIKETTNFLALSGDKEEYKQKYLAIYDKCFRKNKNINNAMKETKWKFLFVSKKELDINKVKPIINDMWLKYETTVNDKLKETLKDELIKRGVPKEIADEIAYNKTKKDHEIKTKAFWINILMYFGVGFVALLLVAKLMNFTLKDVINPLKILLIATKIIDKMATSVFKPLIVFMLFIIGWVTIFIALSKVAIGLYPLVKKFLTK